MPCKPRILKRFVAVGKRLVHYRLAGDGPAVVLLHDSVKSSAALIPLIRRLAPHYRVFALDTPGYGNSDPLDGGLDTVDFANAVKDTLDALGLAKIAIYGRHTSSKVVLELLDAWPERFHVAIMDGLSVPDAAYEADFVARYLPPFAIDDDGAYLARSWTQLRDMLRWFPWFANTAAARMAVAARDATQLHAFALDFLMAGPHYADAYGAALRYDAAARLPTLSPAAPAVFVAAEDDVLCHYLDRLPPWAQRSRIATTSDVPDAIAAILAEKVPREPDVRTPAASVVADRFYHDLPDGQMHVRRHGTGAPMVFLHEAPGGATSALPFIRALAAHGTVLSPDLPGGGESDPLPHASAVAYVDALADMIDAHAGGHAVAVIAMTTSTPLAVLLAARHPQKVGSLVLDGLVRGDADLAARYCPPVTFDPSGAHVHRLWHMLRDQIVQWPWYDGSVAAIRRVDAQSSGLRLHRRLLDVLKQFDHYGDAAKAAFTVDLDETLTAVRCPVLLPQVPGDPAYARSADTVPLAEKPERPAGAEGRAAQIAAFIAQR